MYSHNPSLPDFLVIGAQKCGTTTLFEDLKRHPHIGLAEKESGGLAAKMSDAQAIEQYHRYFRHLSPHQMIGDVSTHYSMLPDRPEIVRRATRVNKTLKILYIVRDPIERAISHHHHLHSLKLTPPDINAAIRKTPSIVNYGRYATQIAPWISAFGESNILLLTLEEYSADRQAGFDKVARFLGLPLHALESVEVHNSSHHKKVAVGPIGIISRSWAYRSVLRPLIGTKTRERLGRTLLPNAPARTNPPELENLLYLASQYRPEIEELSRLFGPLPWNIARTVQKYSNIRGPECDR